MRGVFVVTVLTTALGFVPPHAVSTVSLRPQSHVVIDEEPAPAVAEKPRVDMAAKDDMLEYDDEEECEIDLETMQPVNPDKCLS